MSRPQKAALDDQKDYDLVFHAHTFPPILRHFRDAIINVYSKHKCLRLFLLHDLRHAAPTATEFRAPELWVDRVSRTMQQYSIMQKLHAIASDQPAGRP